jgi:hypothetical protein
MNTLQISFDYKVGLISVAPFFVVLDVILSCNVISFKMLVDWVSSIL